MTETLTREQQLAIESYVRAALPIAESVEHLLDRVGPGQIGCKCGHVADKAEFKPGRGRSYGQHPDHHYCPACGRSITWFGYLCGDRLAALRARKEAAR